MGAEAVIGLDAARGVVVIGLLEIGVFIIEQGVSEGGGDEEVVAGDERVIADAISQVGDGLGDFGGGAGEVGAPIQIDGVELRVTAIDQRRYEACGLAADIQIFGADAVAILIADAGIEHKIIVEHAAGVVFLNGVSYVKGEEVVAGVAAVVGGGRALADLQSASIQLQGQDDLRVAADGAHRAQGLGEAEAKYDLLATAEVRVGADASIDRNAEGLGADIAIAGVGVAVGDDREQLGLLHIEQQAGIEALVGAFAAVLCGFVPGIELKAGREAAIGEHEDRAAGVAIGHLGVLRDRMQRDVAVVILGECVDVELEGQVIAAVRVVAGDIFIVFTIGADYRESQVDVLGARVAADAEILGARLDDEEDVAA